MARPLLKILLCESETALLARIQQLGEDLRKIMLFVGARNLHELARRPVVVTGQAADWLRTRGISLDFLFARQFKVQIS